MAAKIVSCPFKNNRRSFNHVMEILNRRRPDPLHVFKRPLRLLVNFRPVISPVFPGFSQPPPEDYRISIRPDGRE